MGVYFFIGLAVVVIALFFIVESRDQKENLKKLTASRPNFTREQFIDHFIDKGYPAGHVSALYDELKIYISFDLASLHPEDNLIEHHKIDPEDLEDILILLLKKNKLALPDHIILERLKEKYTKKQTAEHLLEIMFQASKK